MKNGTKSFNPEQKLKCFIPIIKTTMYNLLFDNFKRFKWSFIYFEYCGIHITMYFLVYYIKLNIYNKQNDIYNMI